MCGAGERGVCYEVYELDGRPGRAFLFERGGYDGFSPMDVRLMLRITGQVVEAVRGYTFTNVGELDADRRRGRFSAAFP